MKKSMTTRQTNTWPIITISITLALVPGSALYAAPDEHTLYLSTQANTSQSLLYHAPTENLFTTFPSGASPKVETLVYTAEPNTALDALSPDDTAVTPDPSVLTDIAFQTLPLPQQDTLTPSAPTEQPMGQQNVAMQGDITPPQEEEPTAQTLEENEDSDGFSPLLILGLVGAGGITAAVAGGQGGSSSEEGDYVDSSANIDDSVDSASESPTIGSLEASSVIALDGGGAVAASSDVIDGATVEATLIL